VVFLVIGGLLLVITPAKAADRMSSVEGQMESK
jgi:hypothetical protein